MRHLGWFLVVAAVASPAAGQGPCATPWTSFRNYHEVVEERTGERRAVIDEVTACRTAAGDLSFALQVYAENGAVCRMEGRAKPRREDVFVYLEGGLRVRFRTYGRKLRIEVDPDVYGGARAPAACAGIGVLQLRHHSEQKPAGRR